MTPSETVGIIRQILWIYLVWFSTVSLAFGLLGLLPATRGSWRRERERRRAARRRKKDWPKARVIE